MPPGQRAGVRKLLRGDDIFTRSLQISGNLPDKEGKERKSQAKKSAETKASDPEDAGKSKVQALPRKLQPRELVLVQEMEPTTQRTWTQTFK